MTRLRFGLIPSPSKTKRALVELKEIRQLIDLMKKNGLSVFKMEKEGFSITLKTEEARTAPVFQSAPLPPPAPAQSAPAPAGSEASPAPAPVSNLKEITAPLVGTFYAAPSPESPEFVQVGQEVTPDTVVCIVEAMKVMNEIKAEISGTVVEVCVDNAKPVQYGQVLFRLK